MMRDETILCIAPRVWRSLWRDTQPIMWRIAKRNRVLYFEPGRNPDRAHSAEAWRNLSNFWSLRASRLAENENLVIIPTPSNLPVMRQHLPKPVLQVTAPWVAAINARILVRHVRWAMKQHSVKHPILWLYSPYHYSLPGKFGEKLACYFNYDEFPDFVQNRRVKNLLRRFDNRLCSEVDVVFATSRSQWERRRAVNRATYFVPNGVDFDLFHRALDPDESLPPDIADIPRPIIGYAGWLGYQLDPLLLVRVATAYSTCSVVLVGPDNLPSTEQRSELHDLSNVFFLGAKDRRELPGYLRAFDVALMPYLVEGHVLSIYPLKLHEYLAAGRAVVASAMPELEPFRHVVRIAETNESFVHQVGETLNNSSPEKIESRVAVARENTWDHRVDEMYRVIGDALGVAEEEMVH